MEEGNPAGTLLFTALGRLCKSGLQGLPESRATLFNVTDTKLMSLFAFPLTEIRNNSRISSSVPLATFQVLGSRMWLVPAALGSADM